MFDIAILRIGTRYEDFLFKSGAICQNGTIDILDKCDIMSLRDILKIFRIYQPKTYKNSDGDDRYLLFLLTKLEHAFYVTAGGINLNKNVLNN